MRKVLLIICILTFTSCHIFEPCGCDLAVLYFYNESDYEVTYTIRNEVITIESLTNKTVYSSQTNNPDNYAYSPKDLVESRIDIGVTEYFIYFSNKE